eukprot:scaffold115254_cov56-Cyclotella_meneghiniana.AAC.1
MPSDVASMPSDPADLDMESGKFPGACNVIIDFSWAWAPSSKLRAPCLVSHRQPTASQLNQLGKI